MKINSFSGVYDFLSNFYPSQVYLDGMAFPSVENAYQAAKTSDMELRRKFQNVSPAQSKKLGREVDIDVREWDSKKYGIMETLLRQKFPFLKENFEDPFWDPGCPNCNGHHSEAPAYYKLSDELLKTCNIELIEGNWWGDVYWGVCKGKGQNKLGRLLMEIRESLIRQEEYQGVVAIRASRHMNCPLLTGRYSNE